MASSLADAALQLDLYEPDTPTWASARADVDAALAACDATGATDAQAASLAVAVRAVCASAWNSDEWADARAVLAESLGQGNTYLTWSLALPALRHEPLLLGGGGCDAVQPSAVGISTELSPGELKALDLGGGDQRVILGLLEAGDEDGGSKVLASNRAAGAAAAAERLGLAKAPAGAEASAAPCHILTGGPLECRLANATLFGSRFPGVCFLALKPLDEGRLTLAAGEAELIRLIRSSRGALTHALMVAKGACAQRAGGSHSCTHGGERCVRIEGRWLSLTHAWWRKMHSVESSHTSGCSEARAALSHTHSWWRKVRAHRGRVALTRIRSGERFIV